jgi:hypothetical protein
MYEVIGFRNCCISVAVQKIIILPAKGNIMLRKKNKKYKSLQGYDDARKALLINMSR